MLSSLPSEGVRRTIASVEFPLRGTSRNVVKSLRFQGRAGSWILVCGPSISGIRIVAGLLMQSTLLVLAQGYAWPYSLCLSRASASVCVISLMAVHRYIFLGRSSGRQFQPWTLSHRCGSMITSSFPVGCFLASILGLWSTALVTDYLLKNWSFGR